MIDTADRKRCRRCFGAFLAIVASGYITTAAAAVTAALFEQYDIVTGKPEQRQTVLPGFFLGGAVAELVVMHIDNDGHRRLTMYAFDAAAGDPRWTPQLEAQLGPGVLFVDSANVGGRDRLLTYERGQVNWFDPDTGTERPLVAIAAGYQSTHDLEGSATQTGGELPHVDITRDLNGDGRDDVLIPDIDGFWVSIQSSDGLFAGAVKLGPAEPFLDELVGNLDPGPGAERTYRDSGITAATLPLYLSRVHRIDYNLDGRSDLVFWNKDHFDVYVQNQRGLFDPEPATFATDVHFESEGAYSHAFAFADQGVLPMLVGLGKKVRRTVLHSLQDLNGDGVADLVTLSLAGRSIARQRSVYEVHFGMAVPGGIEFTRAAGAAIYPRGKAGVMQPWGYSSQRFEDFDGDGDADILFRDVAVGLGGMVRALAGNSVAINLEFYRGEDGIYARKPATTRRIRRFAPLDGLGNVFFPPVMVGDVNGDGRADLLVGQGPRMLHIYLGEQGPELFERQARKVAVELPYDERNTSLVDLNRDGKQDLLIHRTPTEHARDEPHRLTTLFAR